MLQTQGFAEIRAHERGVIWRMNRENKEEKSGAAHRVATVVGAVLCVILLPILIINVTLIIRSFTNRDEVPSVGGIFPLIVLTDSMYPDIQSGDLIFCHTEEPENIKIGDYIAFFDPAGNGTSIVTHSVVGISEQNGGIAWITRGIANNADDTMPVPADKLVGVYKSRISKLGNVVMFMQTTAGLIVCVVCPILLLVLWDIFRRRSYEKNRQDDTEALMRELEELRAQKAAEAKSQRETEKEKTSAT